MGIPPDHPCYFGKPHKPIIWITMDIPNTSQLFRRSWLLPTSSNSSVRENDVGREAGRLRASRQTKQPGHIVVGIEWDWNSLQRCDISQTDPNLGLTNWKSFTTMWYTTNRKLEGGTLALRFNRNGM